MKVVFCTMVGSKPAARHEAALQSEYSSSASREAVPLKGSEEGDGDGNVFTHTVTNRGRGSFVGYHLSGALSPHESGPDISSFQQRLLVPETAGPFVSASRGRSTLRRRSAIR